MPYKIGSIFASKDGELYILALVKSFHFSLISLYNGNRYSEAKKYQSNTQITHEELNEITKGEYFVQIPNHLINTTKAFTMDDYSFTIRVGNIIYDTERKIYYLISMTGPGEIQLISLADGNRWSDVLFYTDSPFDLDKVSFSLVCDKFTLDGNIYVVEDTVKGHNSKTAEPVDLYFLKDESQNEKIKLIREIIYWFKMNKKTEIARGIPESTIIRDFDFIHNVVAKMDLNIPLKNPDFVALNKLFRFYINIIKRYHQMLTLSKLTYYAHLNNRCIERIKENV